MTVAAIQIAGLNLTCNLSENPSVQDNAIAL